MLYLALSNKRLFSIIMTFFVHLSILLTYVHLTNNGDKADSNDTNKNIVVKLIYSNDVEKNKVNKLYIDPLFKKVTINSITALKFNVENNNYENDPIISSSVETKFVYQKNDVKEQLTVTKGIPDYHYNPLPIYPMSLREQGISGVVWLRVWVESTGIPKDILVLKSSGYTLMDASAVQSVKKWRFIPARKGHQYLSSWVEFPIRFSLQS